MDRRVTLQSRTLTANAYGEQVASYTDLETVWAEKWDLRGREYFAAQQVSADVTTRWRIRWREDVSVLDRVVYNSVPYDINQVVEIGRQGGLELLTTAVL